MNQVDLEPKRYLAYCHPTGKIHGTQVQERNELGFESIAARSIEPIVRRNYSSFANLLRRCLLLRCPVCGNASIAKAPFRVRGRCSSCRAVFQREQGFFVGAILINVVTTELVILLAYLASLPVINAHYQFVLALLFVIAVSFPVAFYHHSWSIWLTFDNLVEGLPKS